MLGPWVSNAVVLSRVGRLRPHDVMCLCYGEIQGRAWPQDRGPPTAPSPFSPELALASPSPRPGGSPSSTSSCLVHLEALVPRSPWLLSELVVMAGDGHEVLSPCSRKLISGRGDGACLVTGE